MEKKRCEAELYDSRNEITLWLRASSSSSSSSTSRSTLSSFAVAFASVFPFFLLLFPSAMVQWERKHARLLLSTTASMNKSCDIRSFVHPTLSTFLGEYRNNTRTVHFIQLIITRWWSNENKKGAKHMSRLNRRNSLEELFFFIAEMRTYWQSIEVVSNRIRISYIRSFARSFVCSINRLIDRSTVIFFSFDHIANPRQPTQTNFDALERYGKSEDGDIGKLIQFRKCSSMHAQLHYMFHHFLSLFLSSVIRWYERERGKPNRVRNDDF